MLKLLPILVPLVAATTLVLAASPARGEAKSPVAWWIETRPWTCAEWTAPFARELQMSCDAVGGCRVAAEERVADRRAIVHCNEEGWVLEAEGANGQKLWTLELEGTKEDRVRKAAVWIARAERGDDGIEPRAKSPPAPQTAPVPIPTPARDALPSPPASEHRNGVALTLHSMFNPGTGNENDVLTVGARVAAAHPLAGGARMGIALEFDQTTKNEGKRGHTVGRAGVLLAWGAPWTDDWVGISAEAGVAAASSKEEVYGGSAESGVGDSYGRGLTSTYRPTLKVLGHVKGALTVQLPRNENFRPFATASCSALMLSENQTYFAALDLGFAWNAW